MDQPIMSKKDGAVTASTVGTRVITAAGCHVLRIKGYSQTKLLGTGAGAHSCEFEAAGQFWRISYYPNGDYFTSDRDSISLAIELIGSERNRREGYVNAVARFTLLPHHGKQPAESAQPPHSVRLSEKFSVGSERCFRFIKREELQKSEWYLVDDDCFAVRCDIDVVKTWARCDRPQDVVDTTAATGLVWRSGAEDGDSASIATWQTQWRAAWPFAGFGVVLVCMILFEAYEAYVR